MLALATDGNYNLTASVWKAPPSAIFEFTSCYFWCPTANKLEETVHHCGLPHITQSCTDQYHIPLSLSALSFFQTEVLAYLVTSYMEAVWYAGSSFLPLHQTSAVLLCPFFPRQERLEFYIKVGTL